MKIVLYSGQNVVKVIKNVKNPLVTVTGIDWEGDSLNGINLPFLLLDDTVDVGDTVTDALLLLDVKESYGKPDKDAEIADLRRQLAETNALILDFMESIL